MTYNQLITTITSLLESHGMIKTVKNVNPLEWINVESDPVYPVCCFTVNSGTINSGRENVYSVQFFFLDKIFGDLKYETEVISDQMGIASDIVRMFRSGKKTYSIDPEVSFNTISDKQEDGLSGVELTTNFFTDASFDACDAPTV